MKLRLTLVTMIALLAACSHASQSPQNLQSSVTPATAASPVAVSTTNPIDFPLYAGAAIVTNRAWTQRVTSGTNGAVFGQGPGTYRGHEVVAQSSAPMSEVRGWLTQLSLKPPAGYHVAVSGESIGLARAHAQALGLDFNTFMQTSQGKHHAVVVIAIDPQQLDRRAGPLIGLVGKYRMLPQVLRDPLDAQAKERTGFTVSEALDPNSPVGAALAALNQLRSTGDRGIILLDATKE